MKVKTLAGLPPLFWLGLSLLAALGAALFFSDGLTHLARASAAYQRQIQILFTTSMHDIEGGSGTAAYWILMSVCFSYGVVHTLGPGHGKAVIVAYFFDGNEPRAWMDGVLAGAWIAITHTFSALVLAVVLKLMSVAGLFSALAHSRLVELVSYALIVAVGAWRLRAAMVGRTHDCAHHEHEHGCGHGHAHHHAGRDDHADQPRGFFRRYSGLLLLSAAGVAPCAGALILILLALALDVPWAGILGVLAIAAGMTVALAGLGFASMLAHRLIVSDGQARELGRFVSMGASVIVIATGAVLLLGAAVRQMGWA
jgi:ABC-type nickel/cobalt efflux system permease component RcnA